MKGVALSLAHSEDQKEAMQVCRDARRRHWQGRAVACRLDTE